MTETERLSQLTRLLNLLTGFDQKEQDIAAISQSVLTASASPAAAARLSARWTRCSSAPRCAS